MNVLIGTQGWNYPAWVGPFYPAGTRREHMLGLYARAFPTVEVDSTFYATPPEPVLRNWHARGGEGFVFSLKVPQEITHERRLEDVDEPLAHFLERLTLLEDRVGALLVQLSPDFGPTPVHADALRRFVDGLPAAHRWAVEFRDPRWLEPETLEFLGARGVAVAVADGRWIRRDLMMDVAREASGAEFAYLRWMGPDRRITDYSRVQRDRDHDLDRWAELTRAVAGRVRTVFGYFNNHYQGHSPASARGFQRRLGLTPVEPDALREQVELF